MDFVNGCKKLIRDAIANNDVIDLAMLIPIALSMGAVQMAKWKDDEGFVRSVLFFPTIEGEISGAVIRAEYQAAPRSKAKGRSEEDIHRFSLRLIDKSDRMDFNAAQRKEIERRIAA